MKRLKLPILVGLVMVFLMLFPVLETRAESHDRLGEFPVVFLDMKPRCLDGRSNKVIWELKNNSEKESGRTLVIDADGTTTEIARLLPGERVFIAKEVDELVEVYFENGSFMGSSRVKGIVFWCVNREFSVVE